MSHLLQMRGLKQFESYHGCCYVLSHLLQMRGLKPKVPLPTHEVKRRIFYRCVDWNFPILWNYLGKWVASFTDAWIETTLTRAVGFSFLSRIFYRCVDWNHCASRWICHRKSHLLQMRGLKPILVHAKQTKGHQCRIFYRCVDWNL